jgi:hypothetical protein
MDEKSTIKCVMDNVSWLMNVLLCSLQIGFEVGLPTSWLDREARKP